MTSDSSSQYTGLCALSETDGLYGQIQDPQTKTDRQADSPRDKPQTVHQHFKSSLSVFISNLTMLSHPETADNVYADSTGRLPSVDSAMYCGAVRLNQQLALPAHVV